MRGLVRRFLPQSVRGQFAAIIVVAVIVILSSGSAVESFTDYFDLPAVEDSAAQTDVVATLLRRAAYAPEERDRSRVLRFNGWRIDPIRRQLHDPSNARVATTTHEFDLLLAFCRNAGRVLSREELLGVTHAGLAGPIERSVDVHVSRIRQKIEKDARDPVLLKTVRLGGYIFTATVEEA